MTLPVSVSEYYAGKTIFITGATGFMGKVLVEKLLRACPGIKRLYLLMRPKKGQSVEERLNGFLESKLFEILKKDYPEQFKKITIIPGDILMENLGISGPDRKILESETNIIFHCAACVRFDMFIKDAVAMNAVGTKRTLDLTDNMKKLEALVHVSTSYCRGDIVVLEEKLYPTKYKPKDIMNCVEWMDTDLLKHLESAVINPQPNTYGFTKSLAEELVSEYASKYPIAIARPSIVTASFKDPMPGWVDNMNGPTGIMVGAAKGVIRSMYCNPDYYVDAIPVDMAINGFILIAYVTALEKSKEIGVYNVAISNDNPITWGRALDMGREHVKDYPFSQAMWFPGGGYSKCWYHHKIAVFFKHLIPAFLVDFLLTVSGRKPFLMNLQHRINYGINVIHYYTTKQWSFKNDRYNGLRKKISKEDDVTFFTDCKMVDWSIYIRNYIKGCREYCMKEDPATLPQAKKLYQRLYYANIALTSVIYFLLAYFVYSLVTMLF